MADSRHLDILKNGVIVWNKWRRTYSDTPDLSFADLSYLDLSRVNFKCVNLNGTKFERTCLVGANLSGAHLARAFLVEAQLRKANLRGAHLSGADFAAADLSDANLYNSGLDAVEFIGANLMNSNLCECDLTLSRFRFTVLSGTKFGGATLDGTLFADLNLSDAEGLDQCWHLGPSIIDTLTLQRSKSISTKFLRGVGLPDIVIENIASNRAWKSDYASCFISHSTKDKKFVQMLYIDLQANGIRCWYAPHDMRTGGKNLDEIARAVNDHDSLIVILSVNSIASEWVEDEVTFAFEREREKQTTVLFPIRIDDSIFGSNEPWASKVRQRHIGDFRRWRKRDAYLSELERLMRDLRKKG